MAEPGEVIPAGFTHEEILRTRNEKLEALQKEILTNPDAEWQSFKVTGNFEVPLPTKAVIETEALIQDLTTNLKLFQSGPEPLLEHGDIVLNPRNFRFAMEAIALGLRDWEGLKVRIALQRGLTICEEKMKGMNYDSQNPGYAVVSERFDTADKALNAIDHLRPLELLRYPG